MVHSSQDRDQSELIKCAFEDAYRSNRIQQGDDPSTLPDPYGRGKKKTKKKDKRQKIQPRSEEPGGFLAPEDQDVEMESAEIEDEAEAAGGFLLASDAETGTAAAGGFLPPDDEEPAGHNDQDQDQDYQVQSPTYLPISSIPDALTNLNLSSNDPTVLSLFQQASENPNNASRRRSRQADAEQEREVSRERFEEIVKILLEAKGQESDREQERHQDKDEGEDEEAEEEEEQIETANDRRRRKRPLRDSAVKTKSQIKKSLTVNHDDDDEEMGFVQEDDSDSSDSQDEFRVNRNKDLESDVGEEEEESDSEEDDEEIQGSSSSRRTGKNKRGSKSGTKSATGGSRRKRKSRSDDRDEETDEEDGEFSESQRDQVFEIWETLVNAASQDRSKIGLRSQDRDTLRRKRIGKTELNAIIKVVGAKFGEIEIQEMLSEALKLFAPASSPSATRESARTARQAAAGMNKVNLKAGQVDEGETLGIDEFAGVLMKAGLV